MKSILLLPLLGLGSASAASFVAVGGQTNIDLDNTLLGTIGWSINGATGTVPLGANLPTGYDAAYPISASTITGDDVAPTINPGNIEHTGSLTLLGPNSATVTVGNFLIDVTAGGVTVADTLASSLPQPGVVLFDVDNLAATFDDTSGVLTVTGDLDVSSALATALGAAAAAGLDAGDFRIDVNTVPEPSTALLGGLSLLALASRRRR